MLDIAPNHIGVEHPWFQQAIADRNAPTAEYFTFGRHPDAYETWQGHATLPKLNYRSAALRDAIYAGQDAVMRRWLRPPFAIDGWRIDVANMLGRLGPDQLGPEVARGIRAAVKAESPTAYLLGENTFDATAQLAGDQWDASMNYAGFAMPVLEWLAGGEYWRPGHGRIFRSRPSATATLVETLDGFRAAIPWVIARQQYNLVDSHDTARVRSAVGGDDGRLRAALGFLLAYVGVPSIFYGDEVGLEGAGDIAARRSMPWDESSWDAGILSFVRTLIRGRLASAALRSGGFQVLEVADDSLAFLRDTDDELAIVVINRGPADRPPSVRVAHGAVPDRTDFVELLSGGRATVTDGVLPIPPTPPGTAVWIGRPT
jgi:alpha-glucosidase